MNPLSMGGGPVLPHVSFGGQISVFTASSTPEKASPEFTGREFAAGTVTGVRSFRLDKWSRLTGIHKQQVWKPGENLAECRAPKQQSNEFDPADVRRYEDECDVLDRELRRTWGFGLLEAMDGTRRTRGLNLPPFPRKPRLLTMKTAPAHSMAECACGFYGYFDGSDDYRSSETITAVVEGYGETIIGTRGFRAGKARILALCTRTAKSGDGRSSITREQAARLQRIYAGIPVFDRFEDLVTAFPPDRGLEPSPENDPDFWTRP